MLPESLAVADENLLPLADAPPSLTLRPEHEDAHPDLVSLLSDVRIKARVGCLGDSPIVVDHPTLVARSGGVDAQVKSSPVSEREVVVGRRVRVLGHRQVDVAHVVHDVRAGLQLPRRKEAALTARRVGRIRDHPDPGTAERCVCQLSSRSQEPPHFRGDGLGEGQFPQVGNFPWPEVRRREFLCHIRPIIRIGKPYVEPPNRLSPTDLHSHAKGMLRLRYSDPERLCPNCAALVRVWGRRISSGDGALTS